MKKDPVILNSSDIYGTPYTIELETGEVIQLAPPTLKYFESLYATYNITLNEAISAEDNPNIQEELVYIRALSRTMQMFHIARVLVDPEVTFDDINDLVQSEPTVLTKYLQSFAKHLPTGKESKQTVPIKKPKTPSKIWIPR